MVREMNSPANQVQLSQLTNERVAGEQATSFFHLTQHNASCAELGELNTFVTCERHLKIEKRHPNLTAPTDLELVSRLYQRTVAIYSPTARVQN